MKEKIEKLFDDWATLIDGWAEDISYNAEYMGDPNLDVAKEMKDFVKGWRDRK